MSWQIPFLVLCISLETLFAQNVNVTTPDGQITGTTTTTLKNTKYYAFYSIRYAQEPTGALRFQAPVAVEPWSDVYNATHSNGRECYQVSSDSANENEDCLFLNVFAPDPWTTSPMPVMIFIHGGGFIGGSGNGINPGFFMDTSNVIIVTINYRLGPFGFLSTDDDVIPGNAGLKDQTLALKWVQRNIGAFGGDPDIVTIFGQSAGGASVAYHVLSPQSAGLFKGAICMSGTALAPWAYSRQQVDISYGTAAILNPDFENSRNSSELFEYLQSVDARKIDAASHNYSHQISSPANTEIQQGFFYSPIIDKNSKDPFLPILPYEALANGSINNVTLMIGAVSEEGLMILGGVSHLGKSYDANASYLVPTGMHIADADTDLNVGNLLKQEYSPDSDFEENALSVIQFHTEQDFQKSLTKHALQQSGFTDVYFYLFSYSGKMGRNPNTYPGSGNVTHGEDLQYIFQWSNPENYPESDQAVHERMMKLYTNFGLYQNPTPNEDVVLQNVTWPTVKSDNFQYLEIGANLTVESNFKKERYDFWDSLYQKYGVPPFDVF